MSIDILLLIHGTVADDLLVKMKNPIYIMNHDWNHQDHGKVRIRMLICVCTRYHYVPTIFFQRSTFGSQYTCSTSKLVQELSVENFMNKKPSKAEENNARSQIYLGQIQFSSSLGVGPTDGSSSLSRPDLYCVCNV